MVSANASTKRYSMNSIKLHSVKSLSYRSLEELQKDLDEWMIYYNNDRTHQGKMCCGRTPLETLLYGKSIWAEKNLAQI